MITPLNKHGLILWDFVRNAFIYDPFIMDGEDGFYCPIEFGGLN